MIFLFFLLPLTVHDFIFSFHRKGDMMKHVKQLFSTNALKFDWEEFI